MEESKAFAAATLLAQIKTITRVLGYVRKLWTSRYPSRRATYQDSVEDVVGQYKVLQTRWQLICDKEKQMSKGGFVRKGTLQLDNIKNYFKQETTVKDVEAALDFCERYAVENNKIISLGSGFNYDRRLSKN